MRISFIVKLLAFCILAGSFFQGLAQAPEKFKYQSMIRKADGTALADKNVKIRVSILKEGVSGVQVYSEVHSATSNSFGIVNINIGEGTGKTGTFETINWADSNYFIKVEMDENGGTNYTLSGVSQLMSVPYALYAKSAGNAFSGKYSDLTGIPNLADTSIYLKKESDPVFSASVAKSIKAADTTRWSAKSEFDGDYNNLANKPIRINDAQVNLAIGPSCLPITSTGIQNLVIGNTSLANNTTGHRNTVYGINALQYNSTGAYNTAIGNRSLLANTIGRYNTAIGTETLTNNESGNYNTSVGINSLYSNTTGSNNTATGTSALYNSTTGDMNTANGRSSLYSNVTGSQNTAVGYEALKMNRDGNNNTALGVGSLLANTSGIDNVAVGSYTLNKNATGKWNVAVGDSSLFSSTNADKNVAIGHKALTKTTGWDNTATGFQAMASNTSGFDNTAAGMTALSANTTGTGNTAFGKNALSNNTTGSNNTGIGFKANLADGVSNATAIGYDAFVNASNKIVLGNSSATTVGGYGSWSNYSDRRLKENITYKKDLGLDFILQLRTASYNYISDINKRRRDGLIAQDVQQALKDLGLEFSGLIIDEDKDKTLNLSYSDFVIPLINAVQEQQEQIASQQEMLANQQRQIEELKKMVEVVYASK